MKKILSTFFAVIACIQCSRAQWTTNSGTNDAYNNNASGKVGIGTVTPKAKLDVTTGVTVGNTATIQTWNWADDPTNWGIRLDQHHTGSAIDQRFVQRVGASEHNVMTFHLGNVGIGTTTPIEWSGGLRKTLQISGGSSTDAILRITGISSDFEIGTSPLSGSFFSNRNNNDFAFFFASTEQFRFTAAGNLGIGTSTPNSKLAIRNGTSGMSLDPGGSLYYGSIGLNREVTTGAIFNSAGNAFQFNNGPDANFHIQVYNGSGAAVSPNAFVIKGSNGFIGIGTATPQEELSVNGKIRAKEIKVETANWPDYVFKSTYRLPTLDYLKKFILNYQRLPDMPSEVQVSKDGIDLGDMVKLQTKKIEELTLYLIDKDEQLKEQQQTIKQQEARLQALEKLIKNK